MIKQFLFLSIFSISFTFTQSLETQLKVIFGDYLQSHKNKSVRTVGKAIAMSGQMEYEFEKIKSESESTVNYNINSGRNPTSSTNIDYSKLPNNVIFKDGKYIPRTGFEWVYPDKPNDYRVKEIQVGSLNPYSINELEKIWDKGFIKKVEYQYGQYTVKNDSEYLDDIINSNDYYGPKVYKNNVFSKKEIKKGYLLKKGRLLNVCRLKYENYYNQLNQIFLYKWSNDFNDDGSFEFDEFKYKQRTYSVDESFEIAFTYTNSNPDTVKLEYSIFDDYSGKLLASSEEIGKVDENQYRVIREKISSNTLPPGIYLIKAKINFNNNVVDRNNTLMEKFEIIP